MKTLLRMAWLNIWRNKRRATLLLAAMTAGLVGVLFSMGFINGWLEQMLRNAVETYEGHIKIVGMNYQDDPVLENSMEMNTGLLKQLEQDPHVTALATRIKVEGLLSTASHSGIVSVIGIDSEDERRVSTIDTAIRHGTFLTPEQEAKILIGQRLANKFKLRVGKKVVLMSQQKEGDLGSAAFRVVGIFDTGQAGFDERHVYVLQSALQAMLGIKDRITEVVIMLDDIDHSDATATLWNEQIGATHEVYSWKTLLPFVHESIKISKSDDVHLLWYFFSGHGIWYCEYVVICYWRTETRNQHDAGHRYA